MIYISTGGVCNQSAARTADLWSKKSIDAIELSGGKWVPDQLEKLKKLKRSCSFAIHNYFPPHKKPFVFNLAAKSRQAAKESYEHALKAMQWAAELDSNIYSFHAGFLIELEVNELGKKVRKKSLMDRTDGLNRFIDNVNSLAGEAKKYGLDLLIENNVVSSINYQTFNANPFLLATADEIVYTMKHTEHNVNLLIDVAHLKVSSNSLQYDPRLFLQQCRPWIKAYHLSDNDGLQDTNQPFQEDSWFWDHINKDVNYYSLEIYNQDVDILKDQYNLTKKMLGR